MAMTWVWTLMVAFSVVYGTVSGNIEAVGAAALEGAGAAVKLCLGICGVTCLWSGVMEVMSRAGLTGKLSKILRPLLKGIMPGAMKNPETAEAVSANVSANMLGLGNAATPMGIKAATLMAKGKSVATDDLCMFIVVNTASIQLIPATVAGVRAAAGSAAPFDILPAVWLTSAVSVATGIITAKFLKRFWRG